MVKLTTLFEKIRPMLPHNGKHSAANGASLNGNGAAAHCPTRPTNAFTGTATAILFIGFGGRGTIIARHAAAETLRLLGRVLWIACLCIDVWRKETEDTLPGVPPLDEKHKAIVPPITPADFEEKVRNDPHWKSIRDRFPAERLRGKVDSTANGGGADGKIGLLSAFAGEKQQRRRITNVFTGLLEARNQDGDRVRPDELLLVRIATGAGAVGYGGGWNYYNWMLKHLIKGDHVKHADVKVLAAELPSNDTAKARAQQHVLMAKTFVRSIAPGFVFRSTEGPGGMAWQVEGPSADYSFIVDAASVHGQEDVALRRVASAIALFSHAPGADMFADLINGNGDRRAAGLPFATLGAAVIEHDPALLGKAIEVLYARCLLAPALADIADGCQRGATEFTEKLRLVLGNAASADAEVWLRKTTGKTPLDAVRLALNNAAREWAMPSHAASGGDARSTFERSRGRFALQARNIVENIDVDAHNAIRGAITKRVLQTVTGLAGQFNTEVQPGAAHGVVEAALAWCEEMLVQLSANLVADDADPDTDPEATAHNRFAELEAAPCPTPVLLAQNGSTDAPAPLRGLRLWIHKLLEWASGSDELDDDADGGGVLLEVNPAIRQWRQALVEAAATWVPLAAATRLQQALATELESLRRALQELAAQTEHTLTELPAADALLERQLHEVEAAIHERAAAVNLFLPAEEEVVRHGLETLTATARLKDDLLAALTPAAKNAGAAVGALHSTTIAAALQALAGERARSTVLDLDSLLPALPSSVAHKIAALLRDTPLFAHLNAQVHNRPQTHTRLTLWVPEGVRALLEATGGLPSDGQIKVSPGLNHIIGFKYVKGLAWNDFAQAEICRQAHDEAEDRRALYVDERDMHVSDGLLTDAVLDALAVEAIAAGVLLWDGKAFRHVPEGITISSSPQQRRRQTTELATSLQKLRDVLRRGEASGAAIAEWRARIERLQSEIGHAAFWHKVAQLLVTNGAENKLHQSLHGAARDLLATEGRGSTIAPVPESAAEPASSTTQPSPVKRDGTQSVKRGRRPGRSGVRSGTKKSNHETESLV